MSAPTDEHLGVPAAAQLPFRATIAGIGYALPRTSYSSEYVEELIGVPAGWLEPRTGINARRWVEQDETVLTMAQEASERALESARLTAADIDHVVVATYSFDRITPNAAPYLTRAMGIPRSAGAVDVNAACAGWLSGVKYAASMIEAGRAQNVLVVASDTISPFGSEHEKGGIAVMGDGAGAAIITRSDDEHPGVIGEIVIHADGTYADMIGGYRNTERTWMRGQETYMVAVNELVNVTKEILQLGEKTKEDIDLFVFHQANARILQAVAARLDIAPDQSVTYLADTGNISAATIPMAFTRARDDGKLHQGDLVCTAAIGAGYIWAAGLLRWGVPDPA